MQIAYARCVQRPFRRFVPSGGPPQDMPINADVQVGSDADPAGRQTADGATLGRSTFMSSNIYVGNLAFSTTSADLQTLFGKHGEVRKAQVITDRDTGRSRGFGFVEMATTEAAQAAISSLNGHNLDGRDLTVNLAKERSR
jgi:RNA recognition motif-containing protein